MEMIAPMAKLLAEANGIDWRSIQGSGEGGTVVEQDILTYLTRVMNGEEEPPSTPVDEPPPDWNGEMPPMPSMEMLTQAGIESDITDFVATSHPSGAKIPAQQSLDQDALDFELDDDVLHTPSRDDVAAHAPDDLYTPHYASEAPAPIQHQLDAPIDLNDEEALELDQGYAAEIPSASQLDARAATDSQENSAAQEDSAFQDSAFRDDVSAEPVAELPPHTETRDDVSPAAHSVPDQLPEAALPELPAAQPRPESAPAAEARPTETPGQSAQQGAQAAAGFGLGGLLSRLYKRGKPAETQASTPQASATQPVEPVIPAARQDSYAPTPQAEAQPSVQAEPVHAEPVPAEPVAAEPVQAELQPEVVQEIAPEPQLAEAAPAQPRAEEVAQPQAVSGPDSAAEDSSPPALGEPVAASDVADSPTSAPLVADQLREPEAAAAPDHIATVQNDSVQSADAQEPMSQDQPLTLPAHLPPTLDRQSMGARQGVHLHLSVNTQALEDACGQLGDHLGQTLPAELLLARAAARSIKTLGLSSVGVARLDDQTSARSATSLHGSDLRAAVSEYHAGKSGDWADLMVVDAGQLGLDELHLLGDLATLSLGQRQNHQAALTLTGAVSPQAGAAFLKAVADQLQKPVQLLF